MPALHAQKIGGRDASDADSSEQAAPRGGSRRSWGDDDDDDFSGMGVYGGILPALPVRNERESECVRRRAPAARIRLATPLPTPPSPPSPPPPAKNERRPRRIAACGRAHARHRMRTCVCVSLHTFPGTRTAGSASRRHLAQLVGRHDVTWHNLLVATTSQVRSREARCIRERVACRARRRALTPPAAPGHGYAADAAASQAAAGLPGPGGCSQLRAPCHPSAPRGRGPASTAAPSRTAASAAGGAATLALSGWWRPLSGHAARRERRRQWPRRTRPPSGRSRPAGGAWIARLLPSCP